MSLREKEVDIIDELRLFCMMSFCDPRPRMTIDRAIQEIGKLRSLIDSERNKPAGAEVLSKELFDDILDYILSRTNCNGGWWNDRRAYNLISKIEAELKREVVRHF